jgi:hypothetical protein
MTAFPQIIFVAARHRDFHNNPSHREKFLKAAAGAVPAGMGRNQFRERSTSARSLIHGIMSRSLAPTCSIGCAAHLARIALNEV